MNGITNAILWKKPSVASIGLVSGSSGLTQNPAPLNYPLQNDEIRFTGKHPRNSGSATPPESEDISYQSSPDPSDSESSDSEGSSTSESHHGLSRSAPSNEVSRHPYNLRKRQKLAGDEPQPKPQQLSKSSEDASSTTPLGNDTINSQGRKDLDERAKIVLLALLLKGAKSSLDGDSHNGNEDVDGSFKVISYKKSPFGPHAERLGFKRIAGMEPLKADLNRLLVDPLKNPQLYKDYGLENSASGVLLYGPPGNGKTYFAKAVAEEAGANFLEIHPSTIASPYIHQTSKLISEAFDVAAVAAKKSKKPTVLLIDEVDAVAPQRMGDFSNSHNNEEVAEFLNQLNECASKNVFVVATTNLPDQLDPALIRSGRMNARIYVGAPDEKSREQVINLALKSRSPNVVDSKINASALAGKTQGYSISDLQELVNQSARHALERRAKISEGDFKLAMTQVLPSISNDTEEAYKQMMAKFESRPSSEAWKTMYS
jgi:ATP-dependent 26S proteasome regulatory subunit